MKDEIKAIMLEDLVSLLYKIDGDLAKWEKEGVPTFPLDTIRALTDNTINLVSGNHDGGGLCVT